MISRALDSNNDLIIRNGSIQTVSEGVEVIQSVRTRLLFYLGEWFLNVNEGVPWLQDLFTKPLDLRNLERAILSEINNTEGIRRVTDLILRLSEEKQRTVLISFSAETDYGFIDKEEVFVNV